MSGLPARMQTIFTIEKQPTWFLKSVNGRWRSSRRWSEQYLGATDLGSKGLRKVSTFQHSLTPPSPHYFLLVPALSGPVMNSSLSLLLLSSKLPAPIPLEKEPE
jgi:hypothetical protein